MLILFGAITKHTAVCVRLPNVLTTHNDQNELNLFEGDILISRKMIYHYYNITDYQLKTGRQFDLFPTTQDRRRKRAAARDQKLLWPNGEVYYRFDSSLSKDLISKVRSAIDEYETHTCLKFFEKGESTENYISFSSGDKGCYSDGIGMKGGERLINLENPSCAQHGIILHEIGHAIGFWHEQSRPDRDSYVDILYDNIPDNLKDQFMKLKATEVNSFNVPYDYESIMHYPLTMFGSRSTIKVNNWTAFKNQGRPEIGQRTKLSLRDIRQVNNLYNCTSELHSSLQPQPTHYSNMNMYVLCIILLVVVLVFCYFVCKCYKSPKRHPEYNIVVPYFVPPKPNTKCV